MSGFVRPSCAVCGTACIPLADYDAPTCVACDQVMETILARAQLSDEAVAFLRAAPLSRVFAIFEQPRPVAAVRQAMAGRLKLIPGGRRAS